MIAGFDKCSDSLDVFDTFDLLLLAQKHCHLTSELLEALHWNCKVNLDSFVREDLHVDLGSQHFGQIVCGEDYIHFPLNGCVAQHCAIWLSLLL